MLLKLARRQTTARETTVSEFDVEVVLRKFNFVFIKPQNSDHKMFLYVHHHLSLDNNSIAKTQKVHRILRMTNVSVHKT